MRCKYCHNPDTWILNGGNPYAPEEVVKEVLKYKSYINKGGVTVSGGEPLLQIDFVTELFKLLKEENVHTALDTSGVTFNAKDEQTVRKHKRLLNYTDLVLLDIKHIDADKHKEITGHTNERTLDFARFLSDNGTPTWIRHVLVPDLTDDDNSLYKLKEFINGLKTVQKVEVLPYHTMGEVKYEKLGIRYPLKGVQPAAKERVENARRILSTNDNTY